MCCRFLVFVRTVPEWNSLPEACVDADTVTALDAAPSHALSGVHTPHRRDTRKWSDDYRTRTRYETEMLQKKTSRDRLESEAFKTRNYMQSMNNEQ